MAYTRKRKIQKMRTKTRGNRRGIKIQRGGKGNPSGLSDEFINNYVNNITVQIENTGKTFERKKRDILTEKLKTEIRFDEDWMDPETGDIFTELEDEEPQIRSKVNNWISHGSKQKMNINNMDPSSDNNSGILGFRHRYLRPFTFEKSKSRTISRK